MIRALFFLLKFGFLAAAQSQVSSKPAAVYDKPLKARFRRKVHHGIVEVDANVSPMMRMSIVFKFEDSYERLGYYFKAWNRDASIYRPQIINQKEIDNRFELRILDFAQNSALSHCKTAKTGDTSKENEFLRIIFENRSINARPKVDTLNIKLKLFVNPSFELYYRALN